mmetsp:Transcript_108945/g.347844  ORF Transcript_108945/g.347844 Transcript_108945/m.347844 type:complete len:791 (+) Transcript_108945:412-2784(+)
MRFHLLQVGLQLLVAVNVLLLLTLELGEHLFFFEEDLVRNPSLLFEHVLFLKLRLILRIGRLEVFLVLLVACHKMAQGVFQAADLPLGPPDLVVEVVALALQGLFLLGGLEHMLGLAHLLLAILLFHFAHNVLVLALQVVDLLLALRKLDGGLVLLLIGRSQLCSQNLCVNLDFFLPLLHADSQLLLAVLKAVEVLRLGVQVLSQTFHLESKDVVLHESFLFVLHDPGHGSIHDGVLKLQLVHDTFHAVVVLFDVGKRPVGILELCVLALDLCEEDVVQAFLLLKLFVQLLNLPVELVALLDGALAGHSGDLALHELRLEVHSVQQLLLPLPLGVQPADLKLEVLDGRLGATDIAERVSLFGPEPVELLALLIQVILCRLHLFLDHLKVVQHIFSGIFSILAFLVLVFRREDGVVQTALVTLVLFFQRLDLLHFELATLRSRLVLVLAVVFLLLASTHLILHDFDLVLEAGEGALGFEMVQPDSHQLPLGLLYARVQLAVFGLDFLVEPLPLLHLVLLLFFPIHVFGVLLTKPLELFVAPLHTMDGFLPLLDESFTVIVELLEKLSSLVHFNLLGLSLRDQVCELLLLRRILHCELLGGQRQLPDLRVIGSPVLFEGHLVLFFLAFRDRPLLELLLVPVHLQLELIQLLVATEQLIGVAVDLVLGVVKHLLEADRLGLQPPELAASQCLQVLLRLDLVPLRIDKLLSVHELLLDVDEMVGQDFDSPTCGLQLRLSLLELSILPLDLGIELPVRLRSIWWQRLAVQVELGHGGDPSFGPATCGRSAQAAGA